MKLIENIKLNIDFSQLPEGQQNVQGLKESFKSAQLQQAIDSLEDVID